MSSIDEQVTPTYPEANQVQQEQALSQLPELYLDVPDSDLLSMIERSIQESQSHYEKKLKLPARQKKNREYWVGDQQDDQEFYDYQIPYNNNIIHRDLETRIAIAAGRMPDISVVPENPDDPQSLEDGRDLEQFLQARINSAASKRLTKAGLRDNALSFIGVEKPVWDPTLGPYGDFRFERVRPDQVILDHLAYVPEDGFTADALRYVGFWIEEPTSKVLAKFKDKKAELMKELGIADLSAARKILQSPLRYQEVWFSWYDDEGTPIEAVCWIYKKIVLDKRKSPYWDWEGKYNHFDRPRKPVILYSNENLGYSPYDDTTVVEQSIPMQDIHNKRGMQITEVNDRAIPKLVIAGAAMTKEQAEQITPNPNETLYLNGDVQDATKAIATVAAAQPSQGLYADLQGSIQQIDAHMATHSITRGEDTSDASGLSKQVTREGDLTIADDLVTTIIERVMDERANWAVQMMRLYYRDPNKGLKPGDDGYDPEFRPWVLKQPGKNGDYLQVAMNRDRIAPGIAVVVTSSPVDKQTRRSLAIQMSQEKATDPYTFFEDLDLPNPKERTERLLTFLSGGGQGGDGFTRYMKEIGIDPTEGQQPEESPEDQGQQMPGEQDPREQALNDIKAVAQGQIPSTPPNLDPAYTGTIQKFLSSPEFKELPQSAQQNLLGYADQLRSAIDQSGNPAVQ